MPLRLGWLQNFLRRKEIKRVLTRFQTLLALASLTVCAFNVVAQESKTPKARADDEAATRENVKQMESGWNAKHGTSFAKPFAEVADFVIINGMHIRGRDAVEKNHQQIFSTIYKNTTVSLTVKQIRFLRPDVASVSNPSFGLKVG